MTLCILALLASVVTALAGQADANAADHRHSGTGQPRPGFLPPALKSSDIPISKVPTTQEEVNDLTQAKGWGILSPEVLHENLTSSGGLFFEDKPVGVELPHATWAQPWAGGRVKALVVTAPVLARQVVEIAQRLDGEVFTSFLPGGAESYYEDTPGNAEALERMTLDRLSQHDPDVVILSRFWNPNSQNILAPRVWPVLRQRVEAGMGLVLMMPEGRSAKDAATAKSLPPDQWPAVPGLVNICTESYQQPKALDWLVTAGAGQATGAPHFTWWGLPYGDMGKIVLPGVQFIEDGWQTVAKIGGQPWILTKEIGKGRVVVILNFGDLLPFAEREDGRLGPQQPWRPSRENRQLDHRTSVPIKALLWAARKDTGVLLQLDCPQSVSWSQPIKVNARVLSSPLTGRGKMELSVQNEDGHRVFAGESACDLKQGAHAPFEARAPGCNGRYFVDAVLRDQAGRSLNWHRAVVNVEDGLKLTVKPEKDVYKEDETLVAEVTSPGDAAGWFPLTLSCELWDRFGRLIAASSKDLSRPSGDFKTGPPALRFETQLTDCPSQVLMLVARAVAKDKAIAYAEAEVAAPRFGLEDDHRLIAWLPYLWERRGLHLQLVHRLGFDTLTIGPWGPPVEEARRAAWNGLGLFVENANHLATSLSDKNFPGAGPEYDKYLDTTCRPVADRVLRKFGLRLLSMSNEAVFYKGTPPEKRVITPVQETAFRQYLKEIYGDHRQGETGIAALNRQWETDFKAFEEVKPLPYGSKPMKPNFSRFIDWDLFLEHVSVQEQKKTVDLYFQTMGGSCPWGSTSGGNTEMQFAAGATLHGNTMGDGKQPLCSCEPGWFDLTRRSRPGGDGGTAFAWIGYDYPEWKYNYFPWHNVLHGSKTDAVFTTGNAVHPAGAMTRRGQWHLQHEADIRNGIGKLLATSKRKNDPVAVFHSDLSQSIVNHHASLQSDDRLAGQFYGRFREASGRSFMQLLLDAQLHPTYVTALEVDSGRLAEMKILFLCGAFAMSEKTARAIREFANNGGIVAADLAPAIFDEHGKLLAQGWLDEFFGYKRNSLRMSSYPSEYTLGILKDTQAPFFLPKEWFWVELREDDITVTDGAALGQHIVSTQPPAFIFKRHSKGASLYLNYLDTQYYKTRDPRHLNFMRALLQWGPAKGGINPRVEVTDGHVALAQFDVTYFEDDRAIHAGLDRDQRDIRTPDKVIVNFQREGYAYDVRERKHLGHGRSFEVEVPSSRQKLVSLLPCRIEDVTVKTCPAEAAMSRSVRRGETTEYTITPRLTGPPTSLVYRINVVAPDGEESEAYSMKVRTPTGQASYQGRLRTALNDLVGTWTIVATEVVSGKSGKASFQVK
ncbi:MAG: hypothetical protein HY360_09210 [Verrucomicrobia bacterium]|nr:hypothetical protein [Verrucomicrobiota bacterium]